MDKERAFANTLQMLQEEAKKNGNIISEERVREAYSAVDLNEEQMMMVFDYLKKKHIGIGEALKDEDFLEKEEIDYLQIYMDEIGALPQYSDGEKEAYTLSAMAGDVDAQGRLVEIFLPDVVEIAKLYAGQGVFIEDLIGEGNVALAAGVSMLGALEHASEAQGMLGKLIMDAMEDYISECSDEVKADEKVVNKVNKVSEKALELSEELRRKITVEELMAETGMSKKMIMDAIRLSGNAIDTIEYDKADGDI